MDNDISDLLILVTFHGVIHEVITVFTENRERKEMFYLTTHSTHFYLRLYGVRHMGKDHSDSENGNLLPPHRLLFPINS